MGRCDTAPVAEVGHRHVDRATPEAVAEVIARGDFHPVIPDYQDLEAYRAGGGYDRLLALREGGDWEAVQEQVLASGLRGLGGAGFPAGKKWGFVRAGAGPRYLAVNGDEGEPGTFKDRWYLEREPHLMLEGMLIAAWAVEAERCFIYMRDEYPAVLEILRDEIAALEAAGICGAWLYRTASRRRRLYLRRGIGDAGEYRGQARPAPPPAALRGAGGSVGPSDAGAQRGNPALGRPGPARGAGGPERVEKNGRKGLRSYSVSGRVAKPGVYLLPAGSTIRDVIDAAGGMAEGHELKAYQPGGPSSGLLPASLDDVPLDFDTLQPLGSFIGSAAVVVLSDKDSARDAALNMLRFFEDESCGQCTPCRAGCEKAVKLMQAERWDRPLLEELVPDSICGLGQAAPNPTAGDQAFPGGSLMALRPRADRR
jgi:formate dehydrogenase beta subunit